MCIVLALRHLKFWTPRIPNSEITLNSNLPPNVYPINSIKLDRWPKIQNVTSSHSLLGQLYGPNRDQKLFTNSNKVKKPFKNSKNRNCGVVTFVLQQSGKEGERLKKRLEKHQQSSTLWPRLYVAKRILSFRFAVTHVAKRVTASKIGHFSDGAMWRGHRSNLIQDMFHI